MKKKELIEFIRNMNFKFDQMHDEIGNLKDRLSGSHLEHILNKINEMAADLQRNYKRLEVMTNELKGVIAMARGCLEEGRKFIPLKELTVMGNRMSEDIHYLETVRHAFNNILRDLQDYKMGLCEPENKLIKD